MFSLLGWMEGKREFIDVVLLDKVVYNILYHIHDLDRVYPQRKTTNYSLI